MAAKEEKPKFSDLLAAAYEATDDRVTRWYLRQAQEAYDKSKGGD